MHVINNLWFKLVKWFATLGNSKKARQVLQQLNAYSKSSSKKITAAERLGIPKGDRGNILYNSYVPKYYTLGDEAVLMFREYGGLELPLESQLLTLLRAYIPEVRERYGLLNNTAISDEEILSSLYKQALELGNGTKATYENGEPLILFRGDTRNYERLKPSMSPNDLATKRKCATMDNSLGTLFLGELPTVDKGEGVDRYLDGWEWSYSDWKPSVSDTRFGKRKNPLEEDPKGELIYLGNKNRTTRGFIKAYSTNEDPNHINAAIVRTPAVRDASTEISVLNDDRLFDPLYKKYGVTYYGPEIIPDEDGVYLYSEQADTPESRLAMGLHYQHVLDEALKNNLGLLYSEPNHVLRSEHGDYPYYAVPNFNLKGVKWLLPYDFRIPRNWKSNILQKKDGGKLIK